MSRGARIRLLLLRAAIDVVFAGLMRREFIGLENIPRHGPCLLVFNHLSNFDPVLIFVLMRRVGRTDAAGLVAAEYRRNLVHRLAIEVANGRWLRRGRRDRAALAAGLELLSDGWLLGIAPEGGRSRAGGLRRALPGAAFLASRADAPIVPLALVGTAGIGQSWRRLRRPTVTLTAGVPFRLPPGDDGLDRRERLRRSTDLIMGRLAAMLPHEYRGVYASTAEPAASPPQPTRVT
jgi:1-acyl-sn-glycerol-3-phosphate acyltransferase